MTTNEYLYETISRIQNDTDLKTFKVSKLEENIYLVTSNIRIKLQINPDKKEVVVLEYENKKADNYCTARVIQSYLFQLFERNRRKLKV